MAGENGKGLPTDKMSEVVRQMEEQHGAAIFALIVYADGTIRWRSPQTGDPPTDELLMRGWLDKLRDVVLSQSAAQSGKSPLAL